MRPYRQWQQKITAIRVYPKHYRHKKGTKKQNGVSEDNRRKVFLGGG